MTSDRIDAFLERTVEWSVYALMALFPFSKAMIEICFTVALVAWVILRFRRRQLLPSRWDAASVLLALYVLGSFLSIFVSPYLDESIHGIGKVLEEVFFLILVADTFRTKEKIRRLLAVGSLSLLVTCLDAWYQFAAHRDLFLGREIHFTDKNIRLTGPFSDYTALASYLMVWVSILFALLLNPADLSGKTRIWIALMLPLAALVLFHTHSRGGWLSLAAALTFFFLLQKQKILLIGLALTVAAGLFFLPRNMIVHLDAEGKEQSMVERVVLWKRAWDVVQARPWLGTGINTYVRTHQEFDTDKSWRVQNYYAHNSYLQLAAQCGLPTLAALVFFLLVFFARGIRLCLGRGDPDLSAVMKGVLTAVCGLLVMAFVDTVFEPLQTAMLLWLLLGMGFAVFQLDKRERAAA
ncbi:MAG: O-antigen ligase family protein [Candidatus Omnitrophica bacterium]|nr:O-antigen ligase family protein [Candidatus Omnitrophota bacterium]